MLRLATVLCLAVAVLGQQRFGQFGQARARQQQPFGQQPSQLQFGQPQTRQSQFGQNGQVRQQLSQPSGQPLRQQRPVSDPVPILRMNNDQSPDGSFQYGYASADSAVVESQGEQRQIGDGVGTVMQGAYSYTAPNGELIEVRWIADENGFQPTITRGSDQ